VEFLEKYLKKIGFSSYKHCLPKIMHFLKNVFKKFPLEMNKYEKEEILKKFNNEFFEKNFPLMEPFYEKEYVLNENDFVDEKEYTLSDDITFIKELTKEIPIEKVSVKEFFGKDDEK
jgi:hypothetical protein